MAGGYDGEIRIKTKIENADMSSQLMQLENRMEKTARKAQQLEDAMHEKPSLIMLLSAKQETSRLLREDMEERQVRQLIMHRNQEQHQNSHSKQKRNDPER